MRERPNVVIVLTDHTNAATTAAGSPCLKPRIDALAAAGVRFGRCHTTNAICSPARASLMTGLYPSTHGMWDCTHTQRREWLDPPTGRFPHFASLLREAGWRTGYFGKWHVEQSGKLEDFGWDEYDTRVGGAHFKPSAGRELLLRTSGYRDFLLAGVDESPGEKRHPCFDAGIAFVRRAAAEKAPFLCVVSTEEPHDPYIAIRQHFDRHVRAPIPLPPSLRDACLDKPEAVRRMRAVWAGLTDDDWRFVRACHYAVVSFLDAELGRLLDALAETGRARETIVVFTSDHGDMLGGHGLGAKGVATPYEEVYTIPLIMAGPGIRLGVEEREVHVGLADLGPTLLDLCGAPALPGVQGRSFRPVLERRHDPAAWADGHAEFFGQRFVYTQRMTWRGNWKYVFSPGGVDELYDLASDPHERRNLGADPAHRDRLLEMCGRMWEKMKAIGDTSLVNSHYPTLRTAPVGPLGGDGKGRA